jgi:hypothetical protein
VFKSTVSHFLLKQKHNAKYSEIVSKCDKKV